jgi:hypothetical protein
MGLPVPESPGDRSRPMARHSPGARKRTFPGPSARGGGGRGRGSGSRGRRGRTSSPRRRTRQGCRPIRTFALARGHNARRPPASPRLAEAGATRAMGRPLTVDEERTWQLHPRFISWTSSGPRRECSGVRAPSTTSDRPCDGQVRRSGKSHGYADPRALEDLPSGDEGDDAHAAGPAVDRKPWRHQRGRARAGLRLHLELWGPCPRAVRSGSVDRTRSRAACLTLGAWIPLRIRLMGHIWIRA